MKSYRLSELREVIRSTPFTEWWGDFLRVEEDIAEKGRKADALAEETAVLQLRAEILHRAAVDTLSRSDEMADEAARLATQAQEIENRSIGIVAGYEELRFRVSDIWYRIGAVERKIEEGRENAASLSKAATAQAERQRISLQKEYELETQKKAQLWEEVEELWRRTFEIALVMSERKVDARRVRRDSERLFRDAEGKKQQIAQCRLESRAATVDREEALEKRLALRARAQELLDCVAGDRFLYWRRKEDDKSAYAVSLYSDAETFNIELESLAICVVSRQRGADFLEPAREEWSAPADEEDRRFEEYFLGKAAL